MNDNTRSLAQHRMQRAKAMMTRAAQAAIANDPDAEELTRRALEELEAARVQTSAQDRGAG